MQSFFPYGPTPVGTACPGLFTHHRRLVSFRLRFHPGWYGGRTTSRTRGHCPLLAFVFRPTALSLAFGSVAFPPLVRTTGNPCYQKARRGKAFAASCTDRITIAGIEQPPNWSLSGASSYGASNRYLEIPLSRYIVLQQRCFIQGDSLRFR